MKGHQPSAQIADKRKDRLVKGFPQGSCCGPDFWNIQYNSLLNLEFGKRTKAIAFADDLLITIRAETVREAENVANIDK